MVNHDGNERWGKVARLVEPAEVPEGLAARAAAAAMASRRESALAEELVRLGWKGLLASVAVTAAVLAANRVETTQETRAMQAWQQLVDGPLESVTTSSLYGKEG